MIFYIQYQFSNEAAAYRFLNELKHWSLHDVKARLFKQSNTVQVSYEYNSKGFDTTCSDIDELAAYYNGVEV